jgi:hypothetical protein
MFVSVVEMKKKMARNTIQLINNQLGAIDKNKI